MLDPQTEALLTQLAAMAMRQVGADPTRPARGLAREMFLAFAGRDPVGERCRVEAHVAGPVGPGMRLYRPPTPGPAPAPTPAPCVLFLHGGGWSLGDLDSYDGLVRALCAASGAAFLAVEYRLAPEQPFPAAFDDCMRAASWLAMQADALGLDPERLALMGDSAGGALAACVAYATREEIAWRAQVLVYPMLDIASRDATYPSRQRYGDGRYLLLTAAIEAAARWYVGEDPALRRDPRVSPMFIPELGRLPRTLILSAALDPLADEATAFAHRMQAAGGACEHWVRADCIHAYLSFGVLAQARRDRLELARWLGPVLGLNGPAPSAPA